MDTKTEQNPQETKNLIIGGAYISDILSDEKKVGERFGSSLNREVFAKLKANDKGEVKISFFKNNNKREGKKDPDLTITEGQNNKYSIASIFINKEAMLKEEGEKYINFLVSDKKAESVKSEKARNMVVFSKIKDDKGKSDVLGSGWNETKMKNNASSEKIDKPTEQVKEIKKEKTKESKAKSTVKDILKADNTTKKTKGKKI